MRIVAWQQRLSVSVALLYGWHYYHKRQCMQTLRKDQPMRRLTVRQQHPSMPKRRSLVLAWKVLSLCLGLTKSLPQALVF